MNSILRRLKEFFDPDVGSDRMPSRSKRGTLRIFISYRRGDSAGAAGRIFDRLSAHFGADSVFVDIGRIPLGVDVSTALEQEISQCNVVLALIGATWVSRLSEPTDLIRLEIGLALAQGKVVVPILLDGAAMPAASELPDELRPVAYRNAVSVGYGPSFHRDVDILINSLERLPPLDEVTSSPAARHQATPEISVDFLSRKRVFLSHSTLDRGLVESAIVAPLDRASIPSWYARTNIKTATQWEREILKGMEGCGWFLMVASPQSAASEWVKDEVFWAMQHRPSNIITVIMQPCDLYRFHLRLPRLQHIDFSSLGVKDAQDSLVRTITELT